MSGGPVGAAGGVAEVLAGYVAAARGRPLADGVVADTVLHVVDTVGAAVSGMRLEAGMRALAYLGARPGAPEATVVGTTVRAPAHLAAFANAMAAHADETDDSHGPSGTHPGCSVVPVALAVAEARGRSGAELLRAVALGYDVCARVPPALWPDLVERGVRRVHSTHAFGAAFGAAAAAASLAGFDALRCGHVMAYTVQHVSGISTYMREGGHVEKAYAYAGMPAMDALRAVGLVEAGFAGAADPFSGHPSLFSLNPGAEPSALVRDLGSRFAISDTKFKRYPVGSPAQSALDGLLSILREEHLVDADVQALVVGMAPNRLAVVRDRPMPNVNIGFLLHVALRDGGLTFEASHDRDRFAAWVEAGGDARVAVVEDASLGTSHGARVELRTVGGRTLRRHVPHIPGSRENPMPAAEVRDKALELLAPALGRGRAAELVTALGSVDRLADVRKIGPLLAGITGP